MQNNKLSEFELIKKITRPHSYFADKNLLGPGDDCAVFADRFLITTDTVLEGSHFNLDFSSFSDVGWKSLAVSLSDIAAMGGKAIGATIAIQIPESLSTDKIVQIYDGIYQLADRYDVPILGGDTVRSEKLGITSTVIGQAIVKPILRSGARPSDDIWLSNQIGRAQLGLDSHLSASEKNKDFRPFHSRPEPRLELAKTLAEKNLASAMIDISDGLFQDLQHIADASGLSAEIDLKSIPVPVSFENEPRTFLKLCSSGDDYELLFTASPSDRTELLAIGGLAKIGQFKKDNKAAAIYIASEEIHVFLQRYGLKQLGYSHF